MSEKKIIQYLILVHWTLFYATSVMDKIIPDVRPLWVGVDFYSLFVKLFSSLGLKEPLFATIALISISLLEIAAFVCCLFALLALFRGFTDQARKWWDKTVFLSVVTWSLFALGDQIFGDRFNLMEHSIFWIFILISWAVYRFCDEFLESFLNFQWTKQMKTVLIIGILTTAIFSIFFYHYAQDTFILKRKPISGEKITEGIYKFDLPFLADKITMENTLKDFEEKHPGEKINYIYTGPDELNSKKKTHLLLYVFTEKR